MGAIYRKKFSKANARKRGNWHQETPTYLDLRPPFGNLGRLVWLTFALLLASEIKDATIAIGKTKSEYLFKGNGQNYFTCSELTFWRRRVGGGGGLGKRPRVCRDK